MQITTYTVTERRPSGGTSSESFDSYDAAIEHAKKIAVELERFCGPARCSYSDATSIVWSTRDDELFGCAEIELRSTHFLPNS